METLRVASLVAATVMSGLMAGLFAAFSYSVMPGLRRTDDRTMVEAMRAINVAIVNPLFLTLFLGTAIVAGLATVLEYGQPGFGWVFAGLVLYVVTLGITFVVNVPLNNGLAAAGSDVAAARARFEDRWIRWNVVRTLTSTAAFACLTWALVLHGRFSPG